MGLKFVSMEFTDINKNLNNGNNTPGVRQVIYYAPHKDVASWPTAPSGDIANLEAAATLTGDIQMKSGKRMYPFYTTEDTCEVDLGLVGEADNRSNEPKVRFFHPGLHKKLLGFLNVTKNEDMVFIVVDNEGQQYIFGDEHRPATFSSNPDGAGTGKDGGGKRGISFEYKYRVKSLYVYEGSIPLTPAE